MNDLGLSRSDFARYLAQLGAPARSSRVAVSILSGSGSVIGSLTDEGDDRIEDGQVDWDFRAEVPTSAQVRLSDPEGVMRLEGSSPNPRGLFPDRLLQIERHELVPALGRWVEARVFTGPLDSFTREGDSVTISGLGMEALYREPQLSWRATRIPKRMEVDEAVRRLMRAAGESRFRISRTSRRVRKPYPCPRGTDLFAKAAKIAGGAGFDLYYDWDGYLVMERRSSRPVIRFSAEGDGALLDGPAQLAYQLRGFRNTIVVLGRKPKKGKQRKGESDAAYKKRKPPPRPKYIATPPASDPLSPQSLSRGGRPQHYWEIYESDDLRTKAQVKSMGKRLLAQQMGLALDLSFSARPCPHLWPGDPIEAVLDDGRVISTLLRSGSLPLAAGAPMTVGSYRYMRPRAPRRGKR